MMNRGLILFLLLQPIANINATEFINYRDGYKFNLPDNWCVFKREVIEIHTSPDTVFSEIDPYYIGSYYCEAYTFNNDTPIKDHNDLLINIQNHYKEKAWNGIYTINNIELVSKNSNEFVRYFVLNTIDDSYMEEHELSPHDKYKYIYGIADINNSNAYGIACVLNKTKFEEQKYNIDYIFDTYTKESINKEKELNLETSGCYGKAENPVIPIPETIEESNKINVDHSKFRKTSEDAKICLNNYKKDYFKKYIQYCFQENLAKTVSGGCYHALGYSLHTGVMKKAMEHCKEELKHNKRLQDDGSPAAPASKK